MKYYVVFKGFHPGIYDSWEECKAQVEGFSNARYRAYPTCEDATEAYRREGEADELKVYTAITNHTQSVTPDYSAFPEIRKDAIATDGACNRNPGGEVEYRGVEVGTGREIFHVGPMPGGSNNIGEYLGLVHALALLDKRGDRMTPVYTDSKTAISWLRDRRHRSTVQVPPDSVLADLLRRADRWAQTHTPANPVLKWKTEEWGEIPADFGRK